METRNNINPRPFQPVSPGWYRQNVFLLIWLSIKSLAGDAMDAPKEKIQILFIAYFIFMY